MGKISVELLMELHRYAIDAGALPDEKSLRDAVRDQGTLEYIVYKANNFNDTFSSAACLLCSISYDHPFFEANKRTAWLAAEIVLENGYIDVSEEELDKYVRSVASGKENEKDVRKWIESRFKLFKH
jgi:death-on-curing protein